MGGADRLQEFIDRSGINARIIRTDLDCSSVDSSAKSFGIDKTLIIKSICLVLDHNRHIVAIIGGTNRIDFSKLKKELGVEDVRLAHDDEIIELSSYKKGGVPPIGYEAYFIMDSKVSDNEVVYGGGGDSNSLIKVGVEDIIRLDKPRIFDFSE